jgi:hypothetical protein
VPDPRIEPSIDQPALLDYGPCLMAMPQKGFGTKARAAPFE